MKRFQHGGGGADERKNKMPRAGLDCRPTSAGHERIHSGKDLFVQPYCREALSSIGIEHFAELPFGALLGIVRVDDCVESRGALAGRVITLSNGVTVGSVEEMFGNYAFGRWITLTSNARRFEGPLPYKGHQGPFNVPDEEFAGAHLINVEQ